MKTAKNNISYNLSNDLPISRPEQAKLMTTCSRRIPNYNAHVVSVVVSNSLGVVGGQHLAVRKLNAARVTTFALEIHFKPMMFTPTSFSRIT
jgi:hypothetical protein